MKSSKVLSKIIVNIKSVADKTVIAMLIPNALILWGLSCLDILFKSDAIVTKAITVTAISIKSPMIVYAYISGVTFTAANILPSVFTVSSIKNRCRALTKLNDIELFSNSIDMEGTAVKAMTNASAITPNMEKHMSSIIMDSH
ncbi:MAG: hypothetical protein HFE32_04390 [Clostridia bacterium]|nr:hypothetical protein [Clostridia bacterium]